MGLLVECPKCKKRNSPKTENCACGLDIKKAAGKVYWIEYYDVIGNRKRERIGPSKTAAEQRLRKVLTARTEGRHIEKDLSVKLTLGSLCKWYLELDKVKEKRSYDRDVDSIEQLKQHLGEKTRIKDITVSRIESYQRVRLAEPSRPPHPKASTDTTDPPASSRKKKKTKYHRIRPQHNTTPATVNREIACLKTMLHRAVLDRKLHANPIRGLEMLEENNVRNRILTAEEYERLLNECAPHVRPIVTTAYWTGMRKSEVVYLTWDEIDMKEGFIELSAGRTKTAKARSIPIHDNLKEVLKTIPRGLHTNRVFLYDGKPIDSVKTAFAAACRRAEIADFCFHDLRRTAINNLRLAGNDYFRIMAVSGHKTTSVFKRYNPVTKEELRHIKWKDTEADNGAMDTYMDTKEV